MPSIRAVATALPPHQIPQERIRDLAREHFAPAFPDIDRYLTVFRHAQIATRHFVAPLDWFTTPQSLKACNDRFIEAASILGATAARQCLAAAECSPNDIDHLIWVSTTGLAAPSLDAHMINRLGMGMHTRRTPIWGLGCAGGIAGLARAYDYVRAYPDQRVLVLAVETCSTTFQWHDHSKRNLIAASLFADGGAALLIEGDHRAAAQHGPTIIGTQSTLWPDSTDIMGWDIVDTGMQVVFSSRIPGIISERMRDTIVTFLAPHGLTIDDIAHWILHPGGAKVIAAYETALTIDPERLAHTRAVLRTCGNMSSATIFFVLERYLQAHKPAAGEHALLAVLGPGFSCELALLRG